MSNMNSDPNAEVIALSPTTLMATNRFVCEICNKGFQRDQNLQLHRRGHNLPWKLRQRASNEVSKKRVYVCPEPSCVHHNPARALGDLTGIKKHYSRKHGEKKWKCDKCSKKYAVQSDWKAHQKTCGTREYKCDCGTIFSRRDSFITHRAFCDALTEENNRLLTHTAPSSTSILSEFKAQEPLGPIPFKPMSMCGGMFSTTSAALFGGPKALSPASSSSTLQLSSDVNYLPFQDGKNGGGGGGLASGSAHMSATALLQKAAQMGATASSNNNTMNSPFIQKGFVNVSSTSSMRPPYHDVVYESNNNKISGGGAFTNQVFEKDEISPLLHANNNEMGMLSQMLMGSDHHQNTIVTGGNENGNDLTTIHDFLGVGSSTSLPPTTLHDDFHTSLANHPDWSWKQL
ncbi:protein indeterminate-domain 2 [Senna tora]|uniref:Protein indeterminate-domain 2 n=1 Tax=Senna tora TaxID=362788 RepID=A0A834W0L1_9FABA|nr:protein indeterminate-domain 2 [Senna tora]